ncbi:hypothetical protein IR083_07625 [Dysgonomonas sp. GY75]|uniref:hypothetical protein n=1 Tax=Dysgonomonas sp. GY75 TaxID=2780419 RepID=UPI0018842DA2|nr:hypothetical protein [Dysgonomonas sp. GY75]MBF0648686.1 hypothetical protein [Dysgonomonas sp. GY75]
MKNKQQVSDFLARVRCKDEKTESDIKLFLKRNNTRAKFSRNPMYPVIDYESFIDWYNAKVPDEGEVVILETGLTGIFNKLDFEGFNFSISYDGEKLNPLPVTVPVCGYRSPKKEELIKFQRVFAENGIAWSIWKGITKRAGLQDNIYYRISRLGTELGSGVFREINGNGDVVFYCVKMKNKPVRFSLYEVIGKEDEFQFEPMNLKDRDLFAKELKAVNRKYNGYLKRIEPLYLRAGKNEKYYYINDTWKIIKTEDRYKPKDLLRFNRGNYFRTLDDVQEILELLDSNRKSQLIRFKGNLHGPDPDNE